MISAGPASRPPDSSATPAAAPPFPRREAPGRLLHGFSCPVLKTWGSQRLLPFMNVSGKGETTGAEAEGAPTADPECGEDVGLDQVREKLLVNLREAADRMKLVVPQPQKPLLQPPKFECAEAPPSSSATATRPWNLRARRGGPRAPTSIEPHLGPWPAPAAEKRTARLRSGDSERPKFSISLTREEIEEDIYAVTGCRARRRPWKRPRVVQKQLDSLFPGSWLSEVTVDLYRVPE